MGKHPRYTRDSPPSPPRLSEFPEESWFEEEDDRVAYEGRLSRMKILPPRYVGEGAIPEEKYPEFWRLIDVQGLRPFLFMHERYSPRFVVAAFTTVSIQDNLNEEGRGEFYFNVSFMGRTYQFPLAHIAGAWGLKNEATTFRGGNNPHDHGISSTRRRL
ncbi:hypothetical protein PIB30_032937 [Stylosanthes scabra]|uniref:Uncharacterized protein n=1 Tax=Stylosanthes scabra TaxID=79078 RepID=A0ABU6XBI2_9FABA|nr:hypothetical protein [Stylosanthes scabra]